MKFCPLVLPPPPPTKVIKIMTAYIVPSYGRKWEERRKKCFIIFSKDSHLDMELVS